MRTLEERKIIKELHAQGKNNCQISRETGINRRTISDIVRDKHVKMVEKSAQDFNPKKLNEAQEKAYSYVLGQYLGDGHISLMKKGVYRLRIFSDCKYPNLIQEIKNNLSVIFPMNKVGSITKMYKEKPSCEIIFVYSKSLKELFPQHGPLRKHLRQIKLESWQEDIVDRFPKEFLRGLIHSGGCRFITKTTKKQYTRYEFTNASIDIVNLYCLTLKKLNISYSLIRKKIEGMMTVSSYNVLTQRISCVNLLDTFIGPKT